MQKKKEKRKKLEIDFRVMSSADRFAMNSRTTRK